MVMVMMMMMMTVVVMMVVVMECWGQRCKDGVVLNWVSRSWCDWNPFLDTVSVDRSGETSIEPTFMFYPSMVATLALNRCVFNSTHLLCFV